MHYCKIATRSDAFGAAVTECWEAPRYSQELVGVTAGTFWVGNGEYWSQVSFCPFCGQKALIPAEAIA